MAVLETVKIYMKIADEQLVAAYVDMCLEKLGETDISTFRRRALLDLLITIVHHTDLKRLKQIYQYALLQLKDTDRSVQKKSYRLLEMIFSSESLESKMFVGSHLEELQENLSASMSSSSPSAKAPRLRCLIHIFKQLDEENMDFLQAVVPEVVLCTKEIAEKARQAAYVLLVEMGESLLKWYPTNPKAAVIQTYFELILAGLAGSPHVRACTLLALTRITYHFKDYMSDELLGVLIEATCMLLQSGAREIVQAALSFLRVLLGTFDDLTIGRFLEKIVSGLVSMKDTNKHQLRFKSKEIYTRLVKKFGYKVVLNLVPISLHKQLAYINKMLERTKRRKIAEPDDEEDEIEQVPKCKPESFDDFLMDSDSDMNDDEDSAGKMSKGGRKAKKGAKQTQKGAAWLQEGEGSVVDFLDASVSHRVLSTKPKAPAVSKKDSPFKMASDGRMIIQEDHDDESTHKNKGKSDDPIDDLDELLDAFEGPSKKSRKRRIAGDDYDEDEAPKKYQAGGTGIHRPVKKSLPPGAEYKSKKARGDVKKEGKPDPYAYIPLDMSSLNKRKRAKMKGQLKNFVRGAKKGAQKGKKMRLKKDRQ
jgi:ribosomal RNA-processing protein 12